MPAGVYTLRAKVTYDGETDTATFSGVNVEATHTAASAEILIPGAEERLAFCPR
jgi:hypothetical protein